MTLLARDIMQRKVISVAPDMNLAELADLLVRERIAGAPVVDDAGAVIGIVSRSDLVRLPVVERTLAELVTDREEADAEAALGDLTPPLPEAEVRGLEARTVRDAMVTGPVFVAPDTPLSDVARVLVDRHLHRVLVRDGEELVGLISSLDFVRLVAESRLVAA